MKERAGAVVVLLHGLARTSRSLLPLARDLETAGHRTWSATYPSRRLGIEALAADLAARIRREAPAERYFAVTHSLGGIIVRHMRGALPFRGVVMLAPPNRGSRLALALRDLPLYRWIYGPAGQDVTRPESWPPPPQPFAVIAGTRGGSIGNPVSWMTRGLRFFGPGEPNDGTLTVEETKLDGMMEHHLVDASHTFIMRHPEARTRVLALLAAFEQASLRAPMAAAGERPAGS